jgi:hypothetical protein
MILAYSRANKLNAATPIFTRFSTMTFSEAFNQRLFLKRGGNNAQRLCIK